MSTFSKKTFILIILFATFLFLFYTHKLFQQHHDISTSTPPIHQRSLEQIFEPTWKSLKTHPLPKWFQDAKLGIFIHWGLYSVPGWAPTTGKFGTVVRPGCEIATMKWEEWFKNCPYAEWYYNTMHIPGSKTSEYHRKTFGDKDYYDFVPIFNDEIKRWNADKMAEIFERVGARYVVLTTKHHDGFTLWPSKVKNPFWKDNVPTVSRDIVGELNRAVRKRNMKMGFYYSGGIDWTWFYEPITKKGQEGKIPPQPEYGEYVISHYRELIEKYDPDILWNDIKYPENGKLKELFAEFYNNNPAGVVNDRFTRMWYDFLTPEYTEYKKITAKKWESCRGLGFSFGFNRNEGEEHTISEGDLIRLLCNIVSMNGNLLLNVGPQADGTIPPLQLKRLEALGNWLKVNGEAIFETRPWFKPNVNVNSNIRVAFTAKYEDDITVALYLLVFLPQNPPKTIDVPVTMLRPETFGKGLTINDLKFELLSASGTKTVSAQIVQQHATIPMPNDIQQNVHVIVYKVSKK